MVIEVCGNHVLIDEDDYKKVIDKPWRAMSISGKTYFSYSVEYPRHSLVYLHRLIMGASGSAVLVDHADGNTLNNKKENLRICTRAQNGWNRGPTRENKSGYKGVSYHKEKSKWRATISKNKKWYFLGYYKTKEEARDAYREAAEKLHGQFARTA